MVKQRRQRTSKKIESIKKWNAIGVVATIVIATIGVCVGVTLVGHVSPMEFESTSLAGIANMTMYNTVYTSFPLLGVLILVLIMAFAISSFAAMKTI